MPPLLAASSSLRCAARWLRHCSGVAALSEALQSRVTPEVASALARDGYAIVDEALSAAQSATLRAEVHALHAGGHMTPNATVLVRNGVTETLQKARGERSQ